MTDPLLEGFWLLGLVAVVTAMAATVASASGFGFNLLACPLLILVHGNAKIVVPAMHLAWLPLGVVLCWQLRKLPDVRRVALLLAGALPGALIGVWLLNLVEVSVMRPVIGTATIVLALAMTTRFHRPLIREHRWVAATGVISGALGGSTAISGPPVVLLGLNQGWDPSRFRAELIFYFTLLGAGSVAMFASRRMLGAECFSIAAAGVPGLVVGYFAGTWLGRYLDGPRFRVACVVLLCLAGILLWIGR